MSKMVECKLINQPITTMKYLPYLIIGLMLIGADKVLQVFSALLGKELFQNSTLFNESIPSKVISPVTSYFSSITNTLEASIATIEVVAWCTGVIVILVGISKVFMEIPDKVVRYFYMSEDEHEQDSLKENKSLQLSKKEDSIDKNSTTSLSNEDFTHLNTQLYESSEASPKFRQESNFNENVSNSKPTPLME